MTKRLATNTKPPKWHLENEEKIKTKIENINKTAEITTPALRGYAPRFWQVTIRV
jgi:hypothetical protein